MVSEMRARVRNLEQRLHTRVPRLRMVSSTAKKAEASAAVDSLRASASGGFRTPDNPRRLKRMSADDSKLPPPSTGKADTSGWVLIMEENLTPSPRKDTEKEAWTVRYGL